MRVILYKKWYTMGKSRTYPTEIVSYHTRWYLLTYIYLYFYLRGSVQLELRLEMSKQAKIASFRQHYALKCFHQWMVKLDTTLGYVIDAICSLILHRQYKLTQHISASCQLYENTIFVKYNQQLVGW